MIGLIYRGWQQLGNERLVARMRDLTPEQLRVDPRVPQEEARRVRSGEVQIHTRQSALQRLITHDAYHCGEISLVLGLRGLGAIDTWIGLARVAP